MQNIALGQAKHKIRRQWHRLSLAAQFALAGGIVLLLALLFSGWAITDLVRTNVLFHRGAATALFIDSVITPQLQGVGAGGSMAAENRSNLDALVAEPSFAQRIPFLEIWLPDGTIVYSSSPEIIGRRFDLPLGARRAFEGEVTVARTDVNAPEHVARNIRRTFAEIYSPVREDGSGDILAVAEVHEGAEEINATLMDVSVRSWLTVGVACLVVAASLFFIVLRGSRTIQRQKSSLSKRLQETRELATHNRELMEHAKLASQVMTEFSDGLMRTVGSDLHDGPSQLISFATLKVERARRAKSKAQLEQELGDIEVNLIRALGDIRNIAKGLILPSIEGLNLDAIILQAVDLHTDRTGVIVSCSIDMPAVVATDLTGICVYRFVEEGLNNAYKHAHADGVSVQASMQARTLSLSVTSRVKTGEPATGSHSGLGLKGLKARIESLGGSFAFSIVDLEARLFMSLDIGD